jgi:hypothetical protein
MVLWPINLAYFGEGGRFYAESCALVMPACMNDSESEEDSNSVIRSFAREVHDLIEIARLLVFSTTAVLESPYANYLSTLFN